MGRRHDLVIFDCDGVLVDSEPLVNRVYAEMLREVGFKVDADALFREFVGVAMTTRVAVLRKRLAWTPAEDFLPRFHARLRAVVTRELQPVVGVEEVLETLELPFCVASNGNPEEIRFRLEAAGLWRLSHRHVFSATSVERPKPAPDLFLFAARQMGVEPARCMVVEDSVPGIHAAVAAGMLVLGYAAHAAPEALRAEGAVSFTSMSLLSKLLRDPPASAAT